MKRCQRTLFITQNVTARKQYARGNVAMTVESTAITITTDCSAVSFLIPRIFCSVRFRHTICYTGINTTEKNCIVSCEKYLGRAAEAGAAQVSRRPWRCGGRCHLSWTGGPPPPRNSYAFVRHLSIKLNCSSSGDSVMRRGVGDAKRPCRCCHYTHLGFKM